MVTYEKFFKYVRNHLKNDPVIKQDDDVLFSYIHDISLMEVSDIDQLLLKVDKPEEAWNTSDCRLKNIKQQAKPRT